MPDRFRSVMLGTTWPLPTHSKLPIRLEGAILDVMNSLLLADRVPPSCRTTEPSTFSLERGFAVLRVILLILAVISFSLKDARCWAQAAVADPPPVETKSEAKPETKDEAKPETETEPSTDTAKSKPLYIRLATDDNGKSTALQTAIVRFRGKPGTPYAGRVVDLVGVVHIGQREYYEDLDKRLGTYESVLYELVAPDGTRIRPEDLQKSRSLLASMQTGMKDMLNLEYQLELINYMAENFTHADMSPDEFSKDLARRGDSIWKMGARMLGAGMASQASTGGDFGMMFALFSEDRSKSMKKVMARQLVDIESVTAGMDDENGENTLIKGRNEKAFSILRKELDAGKKTLAVFYGAGHLPDMAKRLKDEFYMEAGETTWLDAWDLTRN